jgi:serine phosphatase RsbU (regulator of sigma subunit)
MRRKLVFFSLLLFAILTGFSQNETINDLQSKLSEAKAEERGKLLAQLAKEYFDSDPSRSVILFDSCASLAKQEKNFDRMLEMKLYAAKGLILIGQQDSVRNILLPQFEKNIDKDASYQVLGMFNYLKATVEYYSGLYDSAFYHWGEAINYFNVLYDSTNAYNCKLYIARIYNSKGDYQKSIDLYFEILRFFESRLDGNSLGSIYNDLGATFDNWGNHTQALDYYSKALELYRNSGNRMFSAVLMTNMGETFKIIKEYQKALDYNLQAYEIVKHTENKYFLSVILINLGESYNLVKNYKLGLLYSQQALDLFIEMGNTEDISRGWSTIAQSYIGLKEFKKAMKAVETSQQIAMKLQLNDVRLRNLTSFAQIYKAIGQPYMAIDAHEEFIALKDSVFTSEKARIIEEMQTKYQTQKNEQNLKIQEIELEKNKIHMEIMLVCLFAGLIILIIMIRAYLLKLKANNEITRQKNEIEQKNIELNQQKEEIISQSDNLERANIEILQQKKLVENTHNELLQSIDYASQIQQAVLPSVDDMKKILPAHFLFFRPCNVVSGDFYWARKQDNQLLVMVGDCTGHGIPGAMMSMYVISLLNELFISQRIIHPEELLENLRIHLKKEINIKYNPEANHNEAETYFTSHIRDGIDMSLCFIDLQSMQLEFAGANNPMFIISDGNLIELQPVNNPVGVFIKEKPFERVNYHLKPNDAMYLFTDGYIDQFGSNKTGKYNTTRFKSLLMALYNKDMNLQYELVSSAFHAWKGDTAQTDDITVLGIKL